jgi:hypothetical protein
MNLLSLLRPCSEMGEWIGPMFFNNELQQCVLGYQTFKTT